MFSEKHKKKVFEKTMKSSPTHHSLLEGRLPSPSKHPRSLLYCETIKSKVQTQNNSLYCITAFKLNFDIQDR